MAERDAGSLGDSEDLNEVAGKKLLIEGSLLVRRIGAGRVTGLGSILIGLESNE